MYYNSNEDSIKLSWAKCLLSNEKKNNELRMIYEIYYDVFLKQTFFTQIRT